jgi:hypothetical protein
LPSSGNFFGPKMSRARTKINTVSCQPSGPIRGSSKRYDSYSS